MKPSYTPGSGKTRRITPRNPSYQTKHDPSGIAIPRWAKAIIQATAYANRKTVAQFVCEWAEKLDKKGETI